jgi:metal-sulfur cluster biosynthetic enzyme
VLAVDGLRAAIRNYEERHGLVQEREPTTDEVVRKRLKHVMNPITGLDVIRTKLIKDIQVSDGTVRIVIDLPRDHQFAATIREDIQDKIGHIWDVKDVHIEFTE